MIIFDGLYSFISLILSMLSLYINNYMAKRDFDKFPFGKHILEPIVISIKSLIIAIMCLYSLIDAIKTIVSGGNSVSLGLAIIYSIVSVVGCGVISFYMKIKEKELSSELIKAECMQWFMDTALSTAVLVAFLVAEVLAKTKLNILNPYIDPGMTVVVSLIFIKMPIKTFINSFKEVMCVKADDEINEDIYVLVKEIEEEYKFEDSITRVSKIGSELRIEIDFVYNKDSKLKTLDQMDRVREEINNAIKHIDYNKWLNVSFTGNKKWAI
ncbi:cation diffusion facilitator family transporter [Clostridium celatum]|nr:cation transporter [Clostridium celatum]MCE9654664.1 cation transporter [Clostridium celatum]MDU2266407.1 cation transporter [Clostridium celatum]MDU3722220.1 cation transporter [Clostridium celatum]MDU6295146.1 cation transporter [Clostridium celatum]MDY3359233.1 cation transporter [Clostridium celatum]